MGNVFLFIAMLLAGILSLTAVGHVLMDNRQPAKTMAWVLVIMLVPVVGIVLYLFFGINHRRKRIISQRQLDELTRRSMLSFVGQHDLHVPERQRQLVDLFVNQSMSLPFYCSQLDIMTDGYAFFPELLRDIASATHHIHIGMYILQDDALGRLVADALCAKVRSGVMVRVVYDDVGCWNVSDRFFESMRQDGIEVASFLPVRFPSFTSKVNYRNHRKLVIIDGRVGYVGGMNVAVRYVKGQDKGHQQPSDDPQHPAPTAWRDTMVRLEGSIVYALQRAFLIDWYFVDRTLITDRKYYPQPAVTSGPVAQLVTSGPTSPYPEIMQGYVRIIQGARRYLFIETPYFLPNEPVLFALKTAALSGVDVRLICPLRSDARFTEWASRSYLRELYQAGAKVYLYKTGFLHSKLLVCDDSLTSCGSANVDFRSFENNFESNLFVYDESVALRMKKVFLDDQSHSMPLADIPHRLHPSFFARLWEGVTRLFSPLL
jgi:cardiolipin synthase